MKLVQHIKNIKSNSNKKRIDIHVERYLEHNQELNDLINNFSNKSNSTGVSKSDYVVLYEYVKKNKPKYILECGTGVSTFVLALALEKYVLNDFPKAKIISMESEKKWYEHQISILPKEFDRFVEITHSQIDVWQYSFIQGTVYKKIPNYPYEFVFVDGPNQAITNNNKRIQTCNMDFIKLVINSDSPVSAIIDNRKHTMLAYTNIFGQDKTTFFPNNAFGLIRDVSNKDLLLNDKSTMLNNIFSKIVNKNINSILDHI